MSDPLRLGEIIEPGRVALRDATHVAVAPVVAGADLAPGARVVLADGLAHSASALLDPAVGTGVVGIVDPFLVAPVRRGQRFWLWLFPGTVTGLRHAWEHPALTGLIEETGDAPEPLPGTAPEPFLGLPGVDVAPFAGSSLPVNEQAYDGPRPDARPLTYPGEEGEPAWRSATVLDLCRAIRADKSWGVLPILADALEDGDYPDRLLLAELRAPDATHHRRGDLATAGYRLTALVMSAASAAAVRWIDTFALADLQQSYHGLMEAARDFLVSGETTEIMYFTLDDIGSAKWLTFWGHYATVTGTALNMETISGITPNPYECGC